MYFSGSNTYRTQETLDKILNYFKGPQLENIPRFAGDSKLSFILLSFCRDPILLQALSKEIDIFQHYKAKKGLINASSALLSTTSRDLSRYTVCEVLEFLLEDIHSKTSNGKNRRCKPTCGFHRSYSAICSEIRCGCGQFAGHEVPALRFHIKILVKSLTCPPYSNPERFTSLFAKDMIELITLSSAKRQINAFIPAFIQSYASATGSCLADMGCGETSAKLLSKGPMTSMIFSLDWTDVEKNRIKLVQVLASVPGTLNSNNFVDDSTEELELFSLIMKESANSSLNLLKHGLFWFASDQQGYRRIGSGRWYDVCLFLTFNGLYPELLFYRKYEFNHFDLNLPQIVFLERMSYSVKNNKVDTNILKEFDMALKIHELISYPEEEECKSCNMIKKLGYSCSNCGYLEGEWVCSECEGLNEAFCWICELCSSSRVSFETDFTCDSCHQISKNCNFCKFCPTLGMCSKCKNPIAPYTAVFCMNCRSLKKSLDECTVAHKVVCKLCR